MKNLFSLSLAPEATMTMTNEAARTVAALVNRPVAEIVALNDSPAIYRNVITGFAIEIGRIFKNNVLLTLKEIAPTHRAQPTEIRVDPAGLISIAAGFYNSHGFKPLDTVAQALTAKSNRPSRTPLRGLAASRDVCMQAVAGLSKAPATAAA